MLIQNAKINNKVTSYVAGESHDIESPSLKAPEDQPTMNVTNVHNCMLLREV